MKWIKDSSGDPSFSLTMAFSACLIVFFKVLLNGVIIASFSFGIIDAALIGALLTPTLGAYAFRRHTSAKTQNEQAIEFAKIAANPSNTKSD